MSYLMQPAGRRVTPQDNDDESVEEEGYGSDGATQGLQQGVREPRLKRKRVPRACESCRKRKIKCDGKKICSGCRSNSIMCVYQDAEGARLVKEHMEKFDHRLKKMELMFEDFIGKWNSQCRPETLGSLKPPDADIRLQPSPPVSYAQGLPAGPLSGNGSPSRAATYASENDSGPRIIPTEEHRRNRQPSRSDRATHHSKRRKVDTYTSRQPTYADAYGELHTDEWGQLRYVGLGSTISVIDICIPFRDHINRSLEKKGYDVRNNLLGPAPSVCEALSPQSPEIVPERMRGLPYGHIPPETLITVMVNNFYERLHFILPVISQKVFQNQLEDLVSTSDRAVESDFLPVLYALLALAVLVTNHEHQVFNDNDLAAYRDLDLGSLFFGLSCSSSRPNAHSAVRYTTKSTLCYPSRSLNPVIVLVLQAAYLTAIGSQAEAWISIGQAIRLGQDLGLHRSGAQLRLSDADQERRRYVWWCIYSLDRTLSAALGRPVAIRDADCDIELPQFTEGPSGYDCTGFVAILNLRRIQGDVLATVASVRTVKAGRHVSKTQEMRALVAGLHSELQAWATSEVPDSIKGAIDGQLGVEKLIALSGYFSTLMLLYRFFIGNPHRPSPLEGNEALFQCARAATNCIRITDKVVASVPICPDLIFHAQHIFTSSVILLQCIRRSEDTVFIQDALRDVEMAMHSLRQLQHLWPGATRFTATIEEYIEFTIKFIEGGHLGRCAFHHDREEFTGLELRDGSGKFPPDWAQLALKRLPAAPSRISQLQAVHAAVSDKAPSRDRSPFLRPNYSNVVDLTNNNPGGLVSGEPQPQSSSEALASNLFKFALPQKRQTKVSSVLPNSTYNGSAPIFYTDDTTRYDPTRLWGVGEADNSFDSLLNAGTNDVLFDNPMQFPTDGLWDFQF